jgi:Holliday junction resolvase RusA-like endonuclease
MDIKRYSITPVAKPRMTQRDKWKDPPRPAVAKYRAFCDEALLIHRIILPHEGAHITFGLPMARSWSKARKAAHDGEKHQQSPDLSNLVKALEDACYLDDSVIWHYGSLRKVWAREGYIEIRENIGLTEEQKKVVAANLCDDCGYWLDDCKC